MNFTKYNTTTVTSTSYDEGLRAYLLQIFSFMGLALLLTGVCAFYASSESFMNIMYSRSEASVGLSPIGWIIMLSPLAMVFFLSYKINSMSVSAAKLTFWSYSVLMGLSLGPLFYMYTGESLVRTFFVTASVFGAMSIYGYSTKKDLTSMGSFLFMGLMGIVIASLVNMFMQSSGLNFAISVVGVLIFTGLTAYDTQKLKEIYYFSAQASKDDLTKLSIHGALRLYLDFINLFIMLLRFFGDRRN